MAGAQQNIRLLLAASEVVGFAKTGGLADVAGSLPRALARRGHSCAVILPLYLSVRQGKVPLEPTGLHFSTALGNQPRSGALWRATLPESDVPVYLVEQPEFFERDEPARGQGLYHHTLPDGQIRDYPDNCARFVFFCRAVLEAIRLLDWWPDVLHAHDWQTGLVPVYLREVYGQHPLAALRSRYQRIRTLFTIHNIAYQGAFAAADYPLTGLDWKLFNHRQLEFFGRFNLLKAGIVFADRITTVSRTYAKEIQTPYFGCGLEGVLSERQDRLTGIVNGVDYRTWDPASDAHLPGRYDVNTFEPGKAASKKALQQRYHLPVAPRVPLLGMVARLVDQKGIGEVIQAADGLFRHDLQLVILGEGDPFYHDKLRALRQRYPQRLGLTIGFDGALAHLIEAGSDFFLMPSQFEPCGLNQLYSLKYGAVPVVRATGGLADTIVDCTPATLADGTASGFGFQAISAAGLLGAVERALDLYWNQPEQWRQLVQTAMRQDWSWDRSAAEYEELYQAVASRGA